MKTPNPRISIAKHLAFVFCNSVMRPGAGCSLQDATGAIAVASSKDMLSSHLHFELEQPVPDLKHTSLLLEEAWHGRTRCELAAGARLRGYATAGGTRDGESAGLQKGSGGAARNSKLGERRRARPRVWGGWTLRFRCFYMQHLCGL